MPNEICMFCGTDLCVKNNETTCPQGCQDVGTGLHCQFCELEIMTPSSATFSYVGQPAHFICIVKNKKENN